MHTKLIKLSCKLPKVVPPAGLWRTFSLDELAERADVDRWDHDLVLVQAPGLQKIMRKQMRRMRMSDQGAVRRDGKRRMRKS